MDSNDSNPPRLPASAFRPGDRVIGEDEGERIVGIVSKHHAERPHHAENGDVLVFWSGETYDSSSLGHAVPAELLRLWPSLEHTMRVVEVAGKAHAALPTEGLVHVAGYRIVPGPMVYTRAYVLIIRTDPPRYVCVWADRWEKAIVALEAGEPIPRDWRPSVDQNEHDPEDEGHTLVVIGPETLCPPSEPGGPPCDHCEGDNPAGMDEDGGSDG
jgi:hypothetical protein